MATDPNSPYIYTSAAFGRPEVFVEVAAVTVAGGVLQVATSGPGRAPLGSLPSAAVESGTTIDAMAKRLAVTHAGPVTHLDQLGAVDRRRAGGGAIVVTYLAIVADADTSETWLPLETHHLDQAALSPDHRQVVASAVDRMRRDLDSVAFAFLPDEFTVLDLQRVHEAILGVPLRKDTFRRRILTSALLDPTGRRQEGVSHRPAELYRLRRS